MTYSLNELGGWIVPAKTIIPSDTVIPACSTLGDWCTLEGVICRRFLTMANLDGSGRQILLVTDGEIVVIRAGCFRGAPDKFALRASAEAKHIYARLIPMVAAELLSAAKGGAQ